MKFHFIQAKIDEFCKFSAKFVKFLSEFHEELQNIINILEILRKMPEKIGNIAGNCWKLCRFHSFISFFQSYPYL